MCVCFRYNQNIKMCQMLQIIKSFHHFSLWIFCTCTGTLSMMDDGRTIIFKVNLMIINNEQHFNLLIQLVYENNIIILLKNTVPGMCKLVKKFY